MSTRKILLLLSSLLILVLPSCRSSKKIVGGSGDLPTRYSQVFGLLQAAETRLDYGFLQYETKNAKTELTYGTKNFNARLNIKFTLSKPTYISGRLAFPPISVGEVTVTDSKAVVSSKFINGKPEVALPEVANVVLQDALLGILPPFYRLTGDKDFTAYDVRLTKEGIYVMTRKIEGCEVEVGVRGATRVLDYINLYYKGFICKVKIGDYMKVDGELIPSGLTLEYKSASRTVNGSQGKLEIQISNVTLQREKVNQ